MKYECVKVPKVIECKLDASDSYTRIVVYECLCGEGTIEFSRVPGFDDYWFDIKCPACQKKYHSFIDLYGGDWKVYPKD